MPLTNSSLSHFTQGFQINFVFNGSNVILDTSCVTVDVVLHVSALPNDGADFFLGNHKMHILTIHD